MVTQLDLAGIGMTSQRTRNRLIERLQEQGIENTQILQVILNTPRHIFVDEALSHRAYEDSSLPIGHNQTISQPYIVAKMTQLLMEKKPAKVLELGTGSGYQTIVLAQLVDEVISVERIKPLLDKAKSRAKLLQVKNVKFFHADGADGQKVHAPFDAILSAAAPHSVPQSLIDQLAIGGRLVMPVGGETQHLVVIDKTADGIEESIIEPVRFVPLLAGRQ